MVVGYGSWNNLDADFGSRTPDAGFCIIGLHPGIAPPGFNAAEVESRWCNAMTQNPGSKISVQSHKIHDFTGQFPRRH
jgi:hypothetical protein